MGRSILGVIVGYVVMFVVVFVTFTAAYLFMGPDTAFRPESYEPSMLWNLTAFVLGFIAAVAGGFVCIAIAKRKGAVTALVVVVLVLGMVGAIMTFTSSDAVDEVRTGDVTNMEAMMKTRTPLWTALLNPIIGIVGVLVGARLKKTEA